MFLKDLEFNKFVSVDDKTCVRISLTTGSGSFSHHSRSDKEKDKFDSDKNNAIRCKEVSV